MAQPSPGRSKSEQASIIAEEVDVTYRNNLSTAWRESRNGYARKSRQTTESGAQEYPCI
jgi:hypothetical protein